MTQPTPIDFKLNENLQRARILYQAMMNEQTQESSSNAQEIVSQNQSITLFLALLCVATYPHNQPAQRKHLETKLREFMECDDDYSLFIILFTALIKEGKNLNQETSLVKPILGRLPSQKFVDNRDSILWVGEKSDLGEGQIDPTATSILNSLTQLIRARLDKIRDLVLHPYLSTAGNNRTIPKTIGQIRETLNNKKLTPSKQLELVSGHAHISQSRNPVTALFSQLVRGRDPLVNDVYWLLKKALFTDEAVFDSRVVELSYRLNQAERPTPAGVGASSTQEAGPSRFGIGGDQAL